MKRLAVVMLAAALLLTGCGDTVKDIEHRHELKVACEKAGGHFYDQTVDGPATCDLSTRPR